MDTIIQHFGEKITTELKKVLDEIFLSGNGDISEVVETLNNVFSAYGCKIIKHILEESDEIIREAAGRKKNWVIKQRDMEKGLITEFGEVSYKRTYYESKGDKGYTYLVDDHFGIDRYQRIDKNLTAKMIAYSKDHSYQRSADLAVKKVNLTRQTVKNKIRKLGEVDNRNLNKVEGKKEIKRLYVEADEDHIALQKGKNTIVKLVYVHEGIKKSGSRNQLKNAHYFSGLYGDVEELWLEVLDYIDANYKLDKIETIYLAGDGASWIIEGLKWLPHSRYVLDRYHLNKYVLQATGHMPQERPRIWKALNDFAYHKTDQILKEIINKTEKETKKEAVKESRRYILGNWSGIEIYKKDPHALGCSAEGHVSHVLSARMSSRPLGWSKKGGDQMARLRAFKYNGGHKSDIRELLDKKKKVKKLRLQTEQILKKGSKRSLHSNPKETIPALKKGKVTGLFKALKAVAY
ncbi:MAG: ISLre2 family transposase [Elusimicrobiota bacterium]